jgi:hypothetical protein
MQEVFDLVIIYSIVLPLINVFITLTFIRELSNFFGADINLDAITRLI